ncbi:MAG: response regulator transcription factor [Lachnospiraceae bacterium]|nr:response regulator transcription factor [Lachnospiraceae bacterium]
MSKKILVIEDEKGIQEFLRACLEQSGYIVNLASDGVEGMKAFQKELYDLIILDILMPRMDGYAVCELIRQESDVPILMLTALGDEKDQIKGFDVLADDYITKPFSFPVLIKRVEAALRRRQGSGRESSELVCGNIRLNREKYEVYVQNEQIILTSIEFKILKTLLQNQGMVLSRERLMQKIHGNEYYECDDRLVNHHIMNLRKKLNTECIETVRGVGYKIVEPN